jgi:hypothetical protein
MEQIIGNSMSPGTARVLADTNGEKPWRQKQQINKKVARFYIFVVIDSGIFI